MAKHVVSVAASTIADVGAQQGLLTLADAALASLLSNNILSISFQAKNAAGLLGVEMSVTIAYDDEGFTLASPYQIMVLKGASADAAADAAQAWITASQGAGYWIGPVLTQYAPGMRQFTEPYYVLVVFNTSATDGPLNFQGIARPVEWKALAPTTPSTDPFYAGGFLAAPAADANLTEAAATVTLGTAGQPFGAHVFIVASGAGATDVGTVGIRVTGDSIADDGTVTAADEEQIVGDVTALDPNEFHQSTKRWVGQVTIELYAIAGVPTAFSVDINYGWAKFETFSDTPFIVDSLDIYGVAGAAEAAPDIILKRHDNQNWTYSAAAFVPDGGTVIAQLSADYAAAALAAALAPYAYRRTGLTTPITPADGEGLLITLSSPNDAAAFGDINVNVGARVF